MTKEPFTGLRRRTGDDDDMRYLPPMRRAAAPAPGDWPLERRDDRAQRDRRHAGLWGRPHAQLRLWRSVRPDDGADQHADRRAWLALGSSAGLAGGWSGAGA